MGAADILLRLLYPPKCAFCGVLLEREERGMCGSCAAALPYTKNGGRQRADFLTACVAPLYYEGAARDALLRYKFSGRTVYAELFGGLIARCVSESIPEKYDIVSWVPLSAARRRSRGYDQARLLAEAAARELGRRPVRTLKKLRDVPAQSGMGSGEKRRANIAGAYACPKAELIKNKRILLIDDIVTTGATLSECAKTLLLAGAGEVCAAAAARGRD